MAKLSYAHGVSETPLLGETIGANLAATGPAARPRGARRRSVRRRYTYAELLQWSRRVARGLLAAGVDKGDRVGILVPQLPEWVALQFGSALIGAILVNLNPAYRTSELEYVLRQSGVKLLVSAVNHRTSGLPGHGRGGPPEGWPDSSGSSSSASPLGTSSRPPATVSATEC